jgi:hypothetical protein
LKGTSEEVVETEGLLSLTPLEECGDEEAEGGGGHAVEKEDEPPDRGITEAHHRTRLFI